jgi:hypothetical protein
MSDEFTQAFFSYVDRHLSRKEVAEALGNSPKTISSWRSIGIPSGKVYACRHLIEAHRQQTSKPSNVLVMHPSYEQFQRWNRAALDAGQTIEDWAFEGLEDLAARHFANKPAGPTPYALPAPTDSHVAEDPPAFNGDEDPPDLEE